MIRGSQGWTPSQNYWNILERKIRVRRMTWKVFPPVLQLTELGPYLPPVWDHHHPVEAVETVRAEGAPGAQWTTGYQSSHLFTSPSVQWCYRANLYKVKLTLKIFLFVLRQIFLSAGLNKLSGPKQQVYQDIKIIQDNAREVTKSFAELCRYKSGSQSPHCTPHTHTRL